MSGEMLSEYDVIIVGSGIAGLYTALKISEDKSVLVLSKDTAENSNTNLAQGGIAVTFNEDEFESHVIDTLKAGNYYNDEDRLKLMVAEGKNNINTLIDWGVNFDTDDFGKLLLTKEGGHSLRRIIHYKDTTGKEIIRGMLNTTRLRKNITLLEQVYIVDVLTNSEGAFGVTALKDSQMSHVYSNAIVIATGGIGELYANTTNATISTGDGIAMAARAGANIKDMEFVQFHPTALNVPGHSHFLISEAVRGEGGILRNEAGEPFMEGYHSLKDLAPRSIVSKAIFDESLKQGNDKIYLDVTHLGEAFITFRFPNIYNECLKRGINIIEQYIPIVPVQHYIMGGIETDTVGRTNIKGLYACGEVACTGVHGANRMASNSLLEGVVFANRVAGDINSTNYKNSFENKTVDHSSETNLYTHLIREKKQVLQTIMNDAVFIFRNKHDMMLALEAVNKLSDETTGHIVSQEGFELRNMISVAKLIIESALKRTDSLGSHIIEGGQ